MNCEILSNVTSDFVSNSKGLQSVLELWEENSIHLHNFMPSVRNNNSGLFNKISEERDVILHVAQGTSAMHLAILNYSK